MEQMKFLFLLIKILNTTEKHSEGCTLFGELDWGKKINSEIESHQCCFSISRSHTNSTVAFLDKKRRNFEMQIKLSLRSALFCSIDPPPAIIYYLHQKVHTSLPYRLTCKAKPGTLRQGVNLVRFPTTSPKSGGDPEPWTLKVFVNTRYFLDNTAHIFRTMLWWFRE